MKRLFFLLASMMFLVSCGTSPKKASLPAGAIREAQWETKAVVRDLKANKTHSVDIDILADYPERLRMEVSALMGMQVASLALNQEDIQYVVYTQKKSFSGKANEGSFMPLMNIPLHPRNFMSVAFDTPITGPGWACMNGSDNLVSECSQAARKIKVQWSDRTAEGQKKVLIAGPTFEMRWLFRPPKTEVQFKDDTFRLEAPAEFKTIQLK